jgi:hypothetical protein
LRNPPATRPFYAPTADWPLVDRPKFRAWAGRATGVSSTLGFFRLVPTIAAMKRYLERQLEYARKVGGEGLLGLEPRYLFHLPCFTC